MFASIWLNECKNLCPPDIPQIALKEMLFPVWLSHWKEILWGGGGGDGGITTPTSIHCQVTLFMLFAKLPRQQGSWGQHAAHLGPLGPRWAPCWPHEPYYQGTCIGGQPKKPKKIRHHWTLNSLSSWETTLQTPCTISMAYRQLVVPTLRRS